MAAVYGRKPEDVKLPKCGTSAGPVLALWRTLGLPPPDEFAADLVLVIRWAQTSPDPLAENDIRGRRPNGERWGVDRSRNLSTLCVQKSWADRLEAARRWRIDGAPTEALDPRGAGEAAAAFTTLEALVGRIGLYDGLPSPRNDTEARALDILTQTIGLSRWVSRGPATKDRIRAEFVAAWSTPEPRLVALESR